MSPTAPFKWAKLCLGAIRRVVRATRRQDPCHSRLHSRLKAALVTVIAAQQTDLLLLSVIQTVPVSHDVVCDVLYHFEALNPRDSSLDKGMKTDFLRVTITYMPVRSGRQETGRYCMTRRLTVIRLLMRPLLTSTMYHHPPWTLRARTFGKFPLSHTVYQILPTRVFPLAFPSLQNFRRLCDLAQSPLSPHLSKCILVPDLCLSSLYSQLSEKR